VAKQKELHPTLRKRLHVPDDMSDADFFAKWKEHANRVCKPCWELKYCPYGPLVEQSPLLPCTLQVATDRNEYLKQCLETGKVGRGGEPLDDETREMYEGCVANFDPEDYESDPTGEITIMQMAGHDKGVELTREAAIHVNEHMKRSLETGIDGHLEDISDKQREMFQKQVAEFDPTEYPDEIPLELAESECNAFGHICPAIFNAEQITETGELRRTGRYIPFKVKIRVVRRDNYTCQHCGKHLKDNEVEFDHIIPVAKGGNSEEHNIRLTCFDCNRSKSDNVDV